MARGEIEARELPEGVTWWHLIAGGAVAGIGFTVSLFITALAFEDAGVAAAARIGVLLGFLVAGMLGAVLLTLTARGENHVADYVRTAV